MLELAEVLNFTNWSYSSGTVLDRSLTKWLCNGPTFNRILTMALSPFEHTKGNLLQCLAPLGTLQS
jgi:hypothetical protein